MPKGAMAGLLRLLCVSACTVSAPLGLAHAQLIPVKTARVAEADLSSYFPAANAGMGTLLTLPDTVLDPFNNPATGRRIRKAHIVGALASYSMSHDLGTGSTTPLGIFAPMGGWFTGFSVARQRVSPPQSFGFGIPDQSDRNTYGFALLGRSFGTASVGVSAAWSSLGALDGGDLLYPGMQKLARSGSTMDVRLGATKTFGRGTTLEAIVLNARSSVLHDVTYEDQLWDPNLQFNTSTIRVEHDRDRVETKGVHAVLSHPLADTTWRVGLGLTVNRIEHTAMPALGPSSLRRDPGRSSAYNASVGISRAGEKLRFGMDAIYEPIWSRVSMTGKPNDDKYRFNNAVMRGGISADFHPVGQETSVRVLFGAQIRAIQYDRERLDSALVPTTSHFDWNEWTHNWGVSFLDRTVALHLQWRVQSGARRPGTLNPQPVGTLDIGLPGFVGPQIGLLPTRVSTLQIMAAVPIR